MNITIKVFIWFLLIITAVNSFSQEITTFFDSYGSEVPQTVKDSFTEIQSNKVTSNKEFYDSFREVIIPYFNSITIPVIGRITDDKGKPIAGATVSIKEIRDRSGNSFPTEVKQRVWSTVTQTNSSGNFKLDVSPMYFFAIMKYMSKGKVPNENLSLTVKKAGFEPICIDFAAINRKIIYLSAKSLEIAHGIWGKGKLNDAYTFPSINRNENITFNIKLATLNSNEAPN